ncbi:MAG: hypothetical protein ABI353_06070 [Isosphaeraceae bacterium]
MPHEPRSAIGTGSEYRTSRHPNLATRRRVLGSLGALALGSLGTAVLGSLGAPALGSLGAPALGSLGTHCPLPTTT